MILLYDELCAYRRGGKTITRTITDRHIRVYVKSDVLYSSVVPGNITRALLRLRGSLEKGGREG